MAEYGNGIAGGQDTEMRYSVTVEHGSDGSYLTWVHELPGCFVRVDCRDDIEDRLRAAIQDFCAWLQRSGEVIADRSIDVKIAEEIESIVQTAEDTEALVRPDRTAFTLSDWQRIERWLAHSRCDLHKALDALSLEQLESRVEEGNRTIRGQLLHIAFVELMYAAWTFDLRSKEGLRDFLDWTRNVAVARLRVLAEGNDDSLTWAEWAGAARSEPWTARKAARRLIWHERLHLPSIHKR